MKYRLISICLLIVFALVAFYVSGSSRFPFSLGLDLIGGTELTYKADTEKLEVGKDAALSVLRDVIERRVNVFGVSEPVVLLESARTLSGEEDRLLVELPGVTDINEAVRQLGETPVLEFYLEKPEAQDKLNSMSPEEQLNDAQILALFEPSGLTGQYLSRAILEFSQTGNEPSVGVTFNPEGTDILRRITSENRGKILAIVLDGKIESLPVIQDTINNGQASISGRFTIPEAKKLVENLNYGALPVPIELIGTQTIGPTLGANAVADGVRAGLIGTAAVMLLLILWYRLPGLVACLALCVYIILSIAIFKLIPVTLTAAGIAGFILSIGMAVDANILIFERSKEELARGRSLKDSLHEGFHRAWLSIRDSNVSSMITAVILFWIGTSAVKGFALTLGIGVAVSMFTALTLSRTLLFAIVPNTDGAFSRFLFSAGFKTGKKLQ